MILQKSIFETRYFFEHAVPLAFQSRDAIPSRVIRQQNIYHGVKRTCNEATKPS